MRTSCGVSGWQGLATLAARASDAERLELEAHLATCARCAADHAMLTLVRRLRDSSGEGLGAAAHERIRRTIAGYEVRAPRPARQIWWPFGAAAALALGAAAVVWGPLRHAGHGPLHDPSSASSVTGDLSRVVAGDVVVTKESRGALTLRSERGGGVQLGDLSAQLAPGTELGWNQAVHELTLRRGHLRVDRADGADGLVQIRIAHFRVEIAGARFTVDGLGVRDERGHLRIVAADGATVDLAQGESWTAASHEQLPPARPAAARLGISATPSLAASSRSDRHAQSGAGAVAEVAASRRLDRARQALGRGDAAGARDAIEPLMQLDRPVAAEARMLDAESFLIEGRYADAMNAYRLVTVDFPGAAQAESALFAVAELESEHGRAAGAVETFRRYLERYPDGLFAREAGERIARLAPSGQ